MIATFTVATLTALCVVLIAIAWREHERAVHLRIRAEESDSWAQFFEEAAREVAAQLRTARAERDALRGSHEHLQSLYCALVRRRLAETYPLIERNLKRN